MELQEQAAAVVQELHTHKGASPRELGLKHVPSLERHDRSAPHVEPDVTLHTWYKEHHLANDSKGVPLKHVAIEHDASRPCIEDGATVHPSPKPALLSEIRRVAAGRAQAEKQQQHTAGAAGAEAAGAEAAAGSAAGTAGARGAAGGSSSSSSACGEHASHPLPDTPTAADGSGTGN